MSPDDLPDASRLKADLVRVEKYLKVPFERFLDEEACREIATSKNRAVLANEMKRYFRELDWRIRFVKAAPDATPDGTMKLFSVDKAMLTAAGWRLCRLLDGGVVAATVNKSALVQEWRIVALKEFLPVGNGRGRHESELGALLRCFLRYPRGKKFPAKTIGAFQIRTGPGGYAVYLMAHEYFGGLAS